MCRDAPIIGIGRLSAVLPIIGIGRLWIFKTIPIVLLTYWCQKGWKWTIEYRLSSHFPYRLNADIKVKDRETLWGEQTAVRGEDCGCSFTFHGASSSTAAESRRCTCQIKATPALWMAASTINYRPLCLMVWKWVGCCRVKQWPSVATWKGWCHWRGEGCAARVVTGQWSTMPHNPSPRHPARVHRQCWIIQCELRAFVLFLELFVLISNRTIIGRLFGTDYQPTDNRPVHYRCIPSHVLLMHDNEWVKKCTEYELMKLRVLIPEVDLKLGRR